MSEKPKDGTPRLEGKVAGIINERELAINIGSSSGVVNGMTFKVLSDEPGEVTDPDTGQLLGRFEREKVRVKASVVHEKFTICRTFRTTTIGGQLAYSFAILTERSKEVVETLKADDASYIAPLPEEKSYVKKGDRVVRAD